MPKADTIDLGPSSHDEDITALERFVVENDDLLALEERIGRFNIFDALGIVRKEVRHSNFLAWLLDPAGSHGQGDLFLKAVLMDLFKSARQGGHAVPISPVELDGGDLDSFEVRREWNRIDLLLIDPVRKIIVAIENKVDSDEHSDQLNRYEQVLDREFGGWNRLLVFLTPTGDEPSDDDWMAYSYRGLRDVLARVKRTSAGALGGDVGTFLDHYLNLLETRLMEDDRIIELCRRIYANHRRAIDLIVEHGETDSAPVFAEVERALREREDKWVLYRVGGRTVTCMYRPLLEVAVSENNRGSWIGMNFNLYRKDVLKYLIGATITSERERRERVIERLTRSREEFGMRIARKKNWTNKNWLSLGQGRVCPIDPDEPDLKQVGDAVRKQLDLWELKWRTIADVIRTH